jgi:nucleotide-binding universal stress UspA family protein
MNTMRPVVVGVSGSKSSREAVRWAADDAARRHVPLQIVHALFTPLDHGPGLSYGPADFGRLESEGLRLLETAQRQATELAPDIEVSTELIRAPKGPALIDRSKAAQMIVIGGRAQRALSRGMLGSLGSALTRHAHCPVAVLHFSANDPWDLSRPRRAVVVGVDGSDNSNPAIEIAFEEASLRDAKVVALHAWSQDSHYLHVGDWDAVETAEQALLAESLAGFAERYPDVPVERIIVESQPFRHLYDFSKDAELLVVGSHGRGGFAGMTLGSTSQALLNAVSCPMIVARTEA